MGKRLENRSRRGGHVPLGGYTGPILLHAAKKWPKRLGTELKELMSLPPAARDAHGLDTTKGKLAALEEIRLSLGCIVARARIVRWVGEAIVPESGKWASRWRGDWGKGLVSPPDEEQLKLWWQGPWAAELADVVEFAKPIPCKGAQGVFTVSDEVAMACWESRVHPLQAELRVT